LVLGVSVPIGLTVKRLQIEARMQSIGSQRTRPAADPEPLQAIADVKAALNWEGPLQRPTKKLIAVLEAHFGL
jgi:hypothetical protein